ncbi:MAG: AAA family ATPase [Thermoleophilia bacterium]
MSWGQQGIPDPVGQLLDEGRRGRGGALLVRGDRGAGKTRLLAQVAQMAGGMRVVQAAGGRSERSVPYAGLHQLLNPLRAEIGEIAQPQAEILLNALDLRGRPGPGHGPLAIAVLTLLEDLASRCPLTCLIDDFHWFDSESADVIQFVARRVGGNPISMILCVAQDGDPLDDHGLHEIEIEPLRSEEVHALVFELSGRTASPIVSDLLHYWSGGNPLLLVEMVGQLSQEQLSSIDLLPEVPPVSPAVARSLPLQALDQLPDDTRALLLLAAANRGGLEDVVRAGQSMKIGPEAFEPAEEIGLVSLSGRTVRFQPPTVAAALYAAASSGARRDAHMALAGCTLDAEQRVWHLCAAAVGPDEVTAVAAEMAAGRCTGTPRALWFQVRSAELSETPRERVGRLVIAGRMAWALGDTRGSQSILERAARIAADVGARASIALLLGRIKTRAGHARAAYNLLLSTAKNLTPLAPSLAMNLFAGAHETALVMGSPMLAAPKSALTSGALVLESGYADHMPLPWAPHLIEAKEQGLMLEAREVEAVNTGFSAFFRVMSQGDLCSVEVLDGMRRCAALLRRMEHRGELPLMLSSMAFVEYQWGLMAEARRNATEARARAVETGQEFANALSMATLGFVAAAEGKEEELTTLACEARAFDVHGEEALSLALKNIGWAQGHSHLAAGRMSEAFERLYDLGTAQRIPTHHALWSAPDLIEAAVHCRRMDVAREALCRYAVWVETARLPWMRALLARARALISDGPLTEDFFRQSLVLHPGASLPIERARTRLLLGEHLRRVRRVGEARKELTAAQGMFEELNAGAWAARAAVGLKASGAGRRKQGQPVAAVVLTARERQIAELAAGGDSNRVIAERLFISSRTVAYHLQIIYRKLGVRSRAALGGALTRVSSDANMPQLAEAST